MKWINKDKTRSLDLDSVVYWEYVYRDGEGILGTNLTIQYGESRIGFWNEEAEELYKILLERTENKEVLKG